MNFALAISLGMVQVFAMPTRASKRLQEVEKINILASRIVSHTTGQPTNSSPNEGKNQAAVALGKLGARKGGMARAAVLTKKQRSAIASRAAKMRWRKNK